MLENNQEKTPPSTPVLIRDLGCMYPTETSKEKKRFGIYKCRCGSYFKAQTSNIKNGNTQSCGCHKIEAVKKSKTTHGMHNHRLYHTWDGMIARTSNPKHKYFKSYGGRGISICPEWINDKKAFFDWALAHGYQENLTIDRIDNDLGYSPDNCRWVTQTIQSRNTRAIYAHNTSGFRGVSWHKLNKKWTAQIGIDRKITYLGSFTTAIDAAKAYDSYILANNLEHTKNFQYDLI